MPADDPPPRHHPPSSPLSSPPPEDHAATPDVKDEDTESISPATSTSAPSRKSSSDALKTDAIKKEPSRPVSVNGFVDDRRSLSPTTVVKDEKPSLQEVANGEATFPEDEKKPSRKESKSGSATPRGNGISTPTTNGRKAQPVPKREPPLYLDYPDSTEEAVSTFEQIQESIYFNKRLADAEQDGEMMTCECREDWDGSNNLACGEDSDCINRVTRMECTPDDCGCGADCQNMRFQRRQYADVSVIKADKKGFGLRANVFLPENLFIYEYVGEVIDEPRFRKRIDIYAKAGIKHFYFMSLKAGEFIDATKKGGLGRFCNHSCNPNCYVDKWVVGDKLRMGIFAKRDIKAGEELVFDYNVDRYGADPQPCYCGEPNCVGYIGGKTQTDDRSGGARLSHHVLEALGLDDDELLVGTKKARRPRKTGEDDSDYEGDDSGPSSSRSSIPRSKKLTEKTVTKIMSTLVTCKEKWIVHKLLTRITTADDPNVYRRVMHLHGYQTLGRILHEYQSDDDISLLSLSILHHFPRLTRNKITSSKIEPTVQELSTTATNPQVRTDALALLKIWSELETAFRIPRRLNGSAAPVDNIYTDRARSSNPASKSTSPSPRPPPPTAPKSFSQAGGTHLSTPPNGPRFPPHHRGPPPSPPTPPRSSMGLAPRHRPNLKTRILLGQRRLGHLVETFPTLRIESSTTTSPSSTEFRLRPP